MPAGRLMADNAGRWTPHSARDKFPCKGCAERHTACWDHCKRYQDVKEQCDRRKAIEREKRITNHNVSEVKHSGYLAVVRQKPAER